MSEDQRIYDDEIDFFAFFETLWNGKWKIIATTFFATLIGIVYSVNKPNTFKVTTPIERGSQSVFLAHTSLNNLLKKKKLLYDVKTNVNGYQFNSKEVFKMFITEFNDYEEMIEVLSKNDFVKESLVGLEGIGRQRVLINLAKSFEILPPTDRVLHKKNQWQLKFLWHDDLEGIKLFKKAIEQTLLNIQKTSEDNVNKLATAIEIQNSRESQSLYKELEVIAQKQFLQDTKRLQYLSEQLAVAKDLGIETNQLDADAFSDSSSSQLTFFFRENTNKIPYFNNNVPHSKNIPYYLRGSKAIEKEISIIKNRTDKDRLLSSPKYVDIKNQIISIENDLTSAHLRSASKLIELDNPINWVDYDLELADIKSQKKSLVYILVSLTLGAMLGFVYVLISHSILKRKYNSV